jgi:hypothetical protein
MPAHPGGIEWCGGGRRSWPRLLRTIVGLSVLQTRTVPGRPRPLHLRQTSAAQDRPKVNAEQMMQRHAIPRPRKATSSQALERGLGWRAGLPGVPQQATRKRLRNVWVVPPREVPSQRQSTPVPTCGHCFTRGTSITARWLYFLFTWSMRYHGDRGQRPEPRRMEKHEKSRSSRPRKISAAR